MGDPPQAVRPFRMHGNVHTRLMGAFACCIVLQTACQAECGGVAGVLRLAAAVAMC